MNNLREIAQKFNTSGVFGVFQDEKMSNRFSFKVGGTTPLVIEPHTENALCDAVNLLEKENIPYFILGGGTNIVFADEGFDGAVISTVKLNEIEEQLLDEDTVLLRCQCGVMMNTVVNYCTKHCYTGMEPFCGLPGTVGGAAYMNARCFNLEVSDVAGNIEYLDYSSEKDCHYSKMVMEQNKSLWEYKKSPFTNSKKIVTAINFIVKKAPLEQADEIAQKSTSYMKERVSKGHFKYPCAGSVFKNNRAFGKPTGQLIDELGLKGYSIGGAQIAPFHGNIIINTGNATAKDIKELVEYIKQEADKRLHVKLEEEIIFK